MNIAGLSFEALPPISIPFRFFLTAPLFVLLAAILVLIIGPDVWLSRWHPAMLSITHGFTLGFLASIMMGALMQILPVVGGLGFPKAHLVGIVCHSSLVIGTLSLMANFIWPSAALTLVTFLALSLSFVVYLAALAYVLSKKLSSGATITGIRLAMLAMLATAGIGLALLLRNYGVSGITADKNLTNLHALWGVVGWAFVLLVAVSYQILPMFYVAPAFPKAIQNSVASLLFLLMLLLTVWSFYNSMPLLVLQLLLMVLAIYSIGLLKVISNRKRKVPDSSINYWKFAAISLIILTAMVLVPIRWLPAFLQEKYAMLIFAFVLYFVLISIVQSMLLKILPFLSYTHLQQRCLTDFNAMQFLPNMHDLLAKKDAALLFKFHIVSSVTLLLTIVKPMFYWLLALLIIIEFSWLFYLMAKTVFIYRKAKLKMASSTLAAVG